MLKKLLIAVFILGLILTFGNAFADQSLQVQEKPKAELGITVEKINSPTEFRMKQPGYAPFPLRPVISQNGDFIDVSEADESPVVVKSGCYEVDYSQTMIGWFRWEHGTGDDIPLGDSYAMRFDRTSQALHAVNGVRLRIYDWDYAWGLDYLGEDSIIGDADIVVKVWDDAGGLPNTVLYTEVIPMSYLEDNVYDETADEGYEKSFNYLFPFSQVVNITDPSYHISFEVVNNGEPGAYVVNGSDAGDLGVGRGSYYDFATDTWMTSEAYWCPIFDLWGYTWGCDLQWRIVSSYCDLSADGFCYGAAGIPAAPDGWWLSACPSNNGYPTGPVWNGWGQRFTSSTTEFLDVVELWHISYAVFDDGAGGVEGFYHGSNETNNLVVTIWGDDSGEPDFTDEIATRTISGIDNLFSLTGDVVGYTWDLAVADFSDEYIQVPGAYHVTVKTTSDSYDDGRFVVAWDDLSSGGSVSVTGEGWSLAGNSTFWTSPDPGLENVDCGFDIEPQVCADEFSRCPETQLLYVGPWAGNAWWLYGGNITYVAQRVKAQLYNRVDNIKIQIADETPWGGTHEASGDPITRIFLLNDDDGAPGPTVMWQKDVAWGDVTLWPGWHEEVIDNVYIEGDFWIGVGCINGDGNWPTPDNSINVLKDADEVGEINGGGWAFYAPLGYWIETYRFGYVENANLYMEADFCGIPIPERDCDPLNDNGWATFQGDMARTGQSMLPLSDAWCDMTLNWNYIHETDLIYFAAPVIYGDYVVQTFENEIVILYLNGLNAGEEAFVIDGSYGDDGTPGGPQLIGTDLRCTPTIMALDHDDDELTADMDVMFIGGSSQNSVAAVNMADFSVLWQVDVLHGGGAAVMTGPTRYSTFTVLEVNGVLAIVFGTDTGWIVARNAKTGALLWSTQLGAGNPFLSGTTDGTNVYFCTYQASGDGDVYCLAGSDIPNDPDPATPAGTILWELSSAGGLVAATEDYYLIDIGEPEGFQGGIAYDDEDGSLYFVSTCNENFSSTQDGDNLTDGIFYKVYAEDGSHAVDPAFSNRGDVNTPIIDAVSVFCPTFSVWAGGAQGGALMKFNKATLGLEYAADNPSEARYRMSGFRTCEPDGEDDLLFIFNEDGFLECWNSVTGEQMYRRRVMHEDYAVGFSGAIAEDGAGDIHVVFVDSYGGVYDMMKDDTRSIGRLQFETYNIQAAAEFGFNTALPVDFGLFLTNTGCFPVTVTDVIGSDEDFGGHIPNMSSSYVGNDMMMTSSIIADDLTRDSKSMIEFNYDNDIENITRETSSRIDNRNFSSVGLPVWVSSITSPTPGQVLDPGDEVNLVVNVDQTEVSRGSQSLYIQIQTNDPDFFLNDDVAKTTSVHPEASVTLIGGCLLQYVEILFGDGDVNSANIYNTTNLGDQDIAYFYNIMDHTGAEVAVDIYYGGGYIQGNSQYSIAFHTSDWWSNTPDYYVSCQADPNYCDDLCAPHLDADVNVGAMWDAGTMAYEPILADMVCKTWLDSVQNFDTNPDDTITTWDWDGTAAVETQYWPFDDTLTMGLWANTRTFGVHDVVGLDKCVFEIFDLHNRNDDRTIDDWYFGHVADPDGEYYFDGGSSDTMSIDRSISSAWFWTQDAGDHPVGAAYGQIKIPFGCGTLAEGDDWDFNPMINTMGFVGLLTPMPNFMDSVYFFLSWGNGYINNGPHDVSSDDSKGFNTICTHNFAAAGDPGGGDTYSFGVANFMLTGLTAAHSGGEIAPLAHRINKWAGFGRGDLNDDNVINLIDVMYLSNILAGGQGAIPFEHLADVNADGAINTADMDFMIDYYFYCGPCPMGDWMF